MVGIRSYRVSTFVQRTSRGWLRVGLIAALLFASRTTVATAADTLTKADEAKRAQLVAKAAQYLSSKGQADNGSYSEAAGIGPTALVTTSLLRNGGSPTNAQIAKSLAYLEGFVQSDGGIYKPKSMFRNYETCLCLTCIAAANEKGKYDKLLKAAEKFVRQGQIADGVEDSDPTYGGVGYGGKERPDLSNTAFFIEALKTVGASDQDEAIQRALKFVSRCQNHESEHNNTPFAGKNPDGGSYYTPAGKGSSPAGTTPNGGLRSYGAMSYAGLKSMIFAGLTADDPRVKAALKWAKDNYTVSSNPGLGTQGVYYYLHLFSTAMNAAGVETFEDKDGKKHNWRVDLINELATRQNPDGSWTNKDTKWMEGDPNLVTGYALLTLAYCQAPKADAKGAASKTSR